MREVKFRFWDKNHYSMRTWEQSYNSDNLKFLFADDNYIPLQYTGLKDKNGKEIYEGDVLLIQAEGYEPIISEVVWGGTEYPAFDLPKYDGDGVNAFSAIYHNDVEVTMKVIGNVYEN